MWPAAEAALAIPATGAMGCVEHALGGPDASGPSRRLGPGGDREKALEQDVALDAKAER